MHTFKLVISPLKQKLLLAKLSAIIGSIILLGLIMQSSILHTHFVPLLHNFYNNNKAISKRDLLCYQIMETREQWFKEVYQAQSESKFCVSRRYRVSLRLSSFDLWVTGAKKKTGWFSKGYTKWFKEKFPFGLFCEVLVFHASILVAWRNIFWYLYGQQHLEKLSDRWGFVHRRCFTGSDYFHY